MAEIATLIVDMLNPYDHEDADKLAEQAEGRIEPIRRLIEAARDRGADPIYVNDNYDDFTATSTDLVRKAVEGRRPDLVEPITPPEDFAFVQKVRHSAFYSTSLGHLLNIAEAKTVVLAGQVTEQCIFYSALDAYVRGFEVRVPSDCVIPIDPELGDAALEMMRRNTGARVSEADSIFD